jgi:hypothetical protein
MAKPVSTDRMKSATRVSGSGHVDQNPAPKWKAVEHKRDPGFAATSSEPGWRQFEMWIELSQEGPIPYQAETVRLSK